MQLAIILQKPDFTALLSRTLRSMDFGVSAASGCMLADGIVAISRIGQFPFLFQ